VSTVLTIIADVVVLLLSAVQLAMLVRAILSWFPIDSNKFIDFLYGITEPFIVPIRLLFERMNWFQNVPLDVAFMVSYLLLSILSMLLTL
jgi:uncharacterized protein YggT (Ycf19 family)